MSNTVLRRVTDADIDLVQRLDEGNRHLALLALVADTLPAIRDKTLGEIVAMLPDESAILEEGTGDTIWKKANRAQRAPILEGLVAMFAEHLPAPTAGVEPAAPATIDYFEVSAPVTVRLAYPFTVDGETVSEVSLRPPRYADVEGVISGRLGRTAMIAEMTGLSVDAINALRWPDAERVIGVAMDMAPQYAGA